MGARSDGDALGVNEPAAERLAILVHEVRSPVAALAAIAQASRGVEPDGLRRLLALTLAACASIERLVHDVSASSLRLAEVEITGLVEDTVEAWALRGANVRKEVEPGIGAIQADAQRLRQALDNLVSNAVAYTPDGTEIVVGARATDDALSLSVTDAGAGIPARERERIFEPGVRLDVSPRGSGLGLAIVRVIAEAHRGWVAVESGSDGGAVFTIVLPRPAR
jgi:signal transduction histidine kinase